MSKNLAKVLLFTRLGRYSTPEAVSTLRHFSYDRQKSSSSEDDEAWRKLRLGSLLVGVGVGGYLAWKTKDTWHIYAATKSGPDDIVPSLPTYKGSEVAKHYDAKTKIWVSYKRGVYDITDFVSMHPGGPTRIMMAAGGSLEPFWELYPVHTRSDIYDILCKHRIGNLDPHDVVEEGEAVDHFSHEPKRHPALIRRTEKPFNGETPPSILAEQFYTPNDIFYVRNHLPVPSALDADSYGIEIEGIGIKKSKVFGLKDVKTKFPKASISATIQCGGNRRSEMSTVKPAAGLPWTGGAIGNAKWSGARLKDVLKASGFDPSSYPNPDKLHVQFEGLDSDPSGECYGSSIPLSYFLDDNFTPILAYEMNDKALPHDHGGPLRIILPGIVGARSVKWLAKIIVSDQESQSPWQQRDYKVFSPSTTMETVDFSSTPAITNTPVTSYICSHTDGESLQKGPTKLRGYAYAGGGRSIARVEVSKDCGESWEIATISHKAPDSKSTRNWAWVLWEVNLSLDKTDKEVWVKAVDSDYNQQPETHRGGWNYRGLVTTGYHKIRINVK